MTQIGKLLRSIRLKKNISELKAARRCRMEVEEFNAYENNPIEAPLFALNKIFEAIEMSDDDLTDFHLLLSAQVTKIRNSSAATLSEPLSDIDASSPRQPETEGTLEFINKSGIKKKNQKSQIQETE